ncbi:MAG TPA: hypothetical protein VK460_03825 [Burkholderiales bacterium]|nr:hypothetical protein [Burkholderiales bacterium]
MNKLFLPLAAVLISAASVDARGDMPAAGVAEPPRTEVYPAGQVPMVEMPLREKEPMPTGMKKEGMMKEDVKKDYMKKEPMIEEMMEKEEMKK